MGNEGRSKVIGKGTIEVVLDYPYKCVICS